MVRKIWIKHFRNLNEVLLDLTGRPNMVIYGDNNQGKTNFLEAIYCLGHLSVPNSYGKYNLVQLDKQVGYLGADVDFESGSHRVYSKLSSDGDKELRWDDQPIKTTRKIQRLLPIDYLSSDIIHVFYGSPDKRRQDLNRFLSIYESDYASLNRRYMAILKQKRQALKLKQRALLPSLNDQLIQVATQIVGFRCQGLMAIQETLIKLLEQVDGPSVSSAGLVYHYQNSAIDPVRYEAFLSQKLKSGMDKELMSGMSLYGPHREDYRIELDDQDVHIFYSRGINRMIAILLKLSQLMILEKRYNQFPLLLLDDVFSEIDQTLKKSLLRLIQKKAQVFYTTIQKEDCGFLQTPMVCHMKKGALSCEAFN
ncbi:hypothetical protein DID77_04460 [Candidatus Marinamargulisbacteria bacterium SCGC AG-439-L15]|nr:hypothetical protein DID77_04460 [Candidatus Marinamargulisbacteria bacterium SCGC AG-439-L15]